MDALLKPYKYLASFFSHDFIASLKEDSFLYRLLVEKDPKVDILRQHIDECLELAYRYNLVNADLEARSKKGDWESWQATVNELRVAKYLEAIFGINSLHWHPEGQKGKVGEFELDLNNLDKPIFVEIKTVFPREAERLEKRLREKLGRFAEQVPIPFFLGVTIKDVGDSENFSGARFKRFLTEELSKLNVNEIKDKSMKLPDYKDDDTGLLLEIEILPILPKPSRRTCHIGIISGEMKAIQNEVYIKHSLNKAYKQLPEGEQPFLVIVVSSTEFPIDEDEMLNALLGTLGVSFYRKNSEPITTPEAFRKLDGFFQPRRNRKSSAVGLYKEKFTETEIEANLEIYHNPFASNPLSNAIFKRHNVRQLVGKGGQMKWI